MSRRRFKWDDWSEEMLNALPDNTIATFPDGFHYIKTASGVFALSKYGGGWSVYTDTDGDVLQMEIYRGEEGDGMHGFKRTKGASTLDDVLAYFMGEGEWIERREKYRTGKVIPHKPPMWVRLD